MDYENGHKNIFGLLVVLDLKVKIGSTFSTAKRILERLGIQISSLFAKI